MKIWNLISSVASTLFVASILTLAVSPGIASAHGNHNSPCTGPHKNDDICNGGGGGDPIVDPAFAYVRPANGSNKVFLANADGSSATEIFVGLKFTFAPEPAAFGDMFGGKVLIMDFSNLFLVTYSVTGGVINVDPEVMIHDRDIKSSIFADPDWSPDGKDFAFKTTEGSMYIDSRATYNGDGIVEDFGAPIYEEHRTGLNSARVGSIAWDSDNIIHFIAQNPGGGTELRSLDIRACNEIENKTCDSDTTTCIARNGSLDCPGVEELAGMSAQGHVSVNYDASCTAGGGPHILVSGYDDNGDPITFVLDKSLVEPIMPTMQIQNLDGSDWTDRCTLVGSPGENNEGPLHGGAIVEYDPFLSNPTITLIKRRGESPDWVN